MTGPERKQVWFVRERFGRFTAVNWRGPVVFVALMLVLMAGGAVESELRERHPTLALIAMGVLAVVAIALVLVINAHTERRR